jgi:sortase (surface protein transpeptidase)
VKAFKPSAVVPPTTQPEPERIAIPALAVDQDLVELAVIGTKLQVPDDYDDVGWWSGGPAPGEPGAAVVVGHVDSLTGPAVFYGLADLQRGDRIFMEEKDGPRSTFEVRKTFFYDRDDFPSDRVYRSQGRPSLHLLTCGGSFDEATGHYTGNVVVFATLVERADSHQHPGRHAQREDRRKR